MDDPATPPTGPTLREEAERRLHQRTRLGGSGSSDALQHELDVHQIELQLQNEQLRETVLQLEQARDNYAALYEFAPVGYLSLDAQGLITDANRRAALLLGIDPARLRGRSMAQCLAPSSRGDFALMRARLPGSPETLLGELLIQRPQGPSFPARVEARARPGGVALLALIDISAERAAQDHLLKLTETLEESVNQRTARIRDLSQEFQTFALAVAEDLMAPMRRVPAFVHVLQQDAPELAAQHPEHFEHIARAVTRVEMLASALLSYTRASAMRLRLAPLDLNRVVLEVRKALHHAGHAVHVTTEPLPTVLADSTAMQLVFTELLENAAKFAAPGRPARVHISVEEQDTKYVLRFEDNGVGFNPRHSDRLFAPFRRLHPESAYPGAGMGLAIARRICARFEARLWGQGRVGDGATFWIAWPKQPTVLE
ncbi:PAS domain S-box-containing protein [Deinococcus metalli]|uniref:histidine kinase n=1 Tax=Deinococcus metalli TaxID=1141878 RepID=A0A7W8NN78_9DEIO|nr:ATP-binding protein [Deinococcus metalli]MBB5376609.1 PAS domain S-box-containing protein [Deinococcus metalli]GHF42803.1 hypothetical protein GCM10017781_18930 [Deinococcus metalli]